MHESFEQLWESLPQNGSAIEYALSYPKHEFLKYLIEEKKVLLHGSNWNVETLEPRQGNCTSKKFGNLNAVYATNDPILPLFHAIQDKNTFTGSSVSGVILSNGTTTSYIFKVEQKMLEKSPWSRGGIYILSPETFQQGTDDDGTLIDEFASMISVRPLAKLFVSPEDFPYLHDIQPLDNKN